jgi:ElaA protein
MKVNIKKFSELSLKELYSLLKLRVDIFVVEQNCPYPEIDNGDYEAIHFFCKQEEVVISYVRVMTSDEGIVRIGRVVTQDNFRGKGLSGKLMESAMLFIHKYYSGTKIVLAAQEHLQAFYARFGFSSISDMYLEDGIPHVDMEFKS